MAARRNERCLGGGEEQAAQGVDVRLGVVPLAAHGLPLGAGDTPLALGTAKAVGMHAEASGGLADAEKADADECLQIEPPLWRSQRAMPMSVSWKGCSAGPKAFDRATLRVRRPSIPHAGKTALLDGRIHQRSLPIHK